MTLRLLEKWKEMLDSLNLHSSYRCKLTVYDRDLKSVKA